MSIYHLDDIPEHLKQFFVPAPQIGLEKTPGVFIARLVEVFEEVRRVLRDDGTCWINMGDTAAGSNSGLEPKNILGMPWRLAFALQDAGWILRQDIIWHKKSPMPEAVKDRCTKAHEYIFLLAKNAQYFYDGEAIREAGARYAWSGQKFKGGDLTSHHKSGSAPEAADPTAGRNCRSVWSLSGEPNKSQHFAGFPSAIPARCIKAGTSEKGCCPQCGAPWVRLVETKRVPTRSGNTSKTYVDHESSPYEMHSDSVIGNRDPFRHVSATRTIGWEPSCGCNAGEPIPCVVLDCFSGSGTTGMVATELGRRYIGIELNAEYAAESVGRIESWKRRDVKHKAKTPLSCQPSLFE